MCNLKLYHAKRKPYIINTQKCRRLLWARAQLRWTDAKWKSVLWSDESTFQNVFGNDIVSSGPRGNGQSGLLSVQSSKASIFDGMGVC